MKTSIRAVCLSLVSAALLAACSAPSYVHVGPRWAQADSARYPGARVKVATSAPEASRGELPAGKPFSLHVETGNAGRVWIYAIDAEDRLERVFPNDLAHENAIDADRVTVFPGERGGWVMEADEVAGPLMMITVVTRPGSRLEGDLEDFDADALLDSIKDYAGSDFGVTKLVLKVVDNGM